MRKALFNISTTQGMTLAEVLVTLSILVAVMISVGIFQYNILSYNRSTGVAITNAQEVSSLLKFISKELRSAAPSANGSFAIASVASTSITFYADVDGDEVRDQVRYYLSNGIIYRGITEPSGSPAEYDLDDESTKILVTGVANASTTPLFQYFNDAYDGTTAAMTYPMVLTDIRLIKVNIVVDTDPGKSPVTRTFSTQVSLRNLKDNL